MLEIMLNIDLELKSITSLRSVSLLSVRYLIRSWVLTSIARFWGVVLPRNCACCKVMSVSSVFWSLFFLLVIDFCMKVKFPNVLLATTLSHLSATTMYIVK